MTLWGITCYFNPQNYENRLNNYRIFRQTTKAQGLKLCCVQLVFGKGEPDLSDNDADLMITIRGKKKKHAMWQKERLLNIALSKLPEDCTKVCWLDCDLIFQDCNWVQRLSNKLDEYDFVQPFSILYYLPKNWQTNIAKIFDLSYNGGLISHTSFGLIYDCIFGKYTKENYKNIFDDHPTILLTSLGYMIKCYFDGNKNKEEVLNFRFASTWGHGWGIRKEVLDKIGGFYDKCIVGGGDSINRNIFSPNLDDIEDVSLKHFLQNNVDNYSEKHQQDVLEWINKSREILGECKVGAIDGMVLHMYHGKWSRRNYSQRHFILQENNFNPSQDIVLDENGLYCWNKESENTNLKQIKKGIKKYFKNRKEDK